MQKLQSELERKGLVLAIARASPVLQKMLKRAGLIGSEHISPSMRTAVQSLLERKAALAEETQRAVSKSIYFAWLFVSPWKENIIIPKKECKKYSHVDQVYNSPYRPFTNPFQRVLVKVLTGHIAIICPYKATVFTYTFHIHSASLPFVLSPLFYQCGYPMTPDTWLGRFMLIRYCERCDDSFER
jgi:hypothetical protein